MIRKALRTGTLPALLMLGACAGTESLRESTLYTLSSDTVYIHETAVLAERIITTDARTDTVTRQVLTAGTIQAIPTQFAYIAPPFAGRVTRSYVQLGQKVAAHTPLLEIISPEFTEMQKEYFQAQAERELARKDLVRKQELLREGVCSDREYEEAENALQQAEKEYENARAALVIYQIDPETMILGQPMVVRSPIAGNVMENNIITGQYLSEDADPVAVVADLRKVWVTAQVKEKDIRFIREGDPMTISVNALPGQTLSGTVFHIDESVDEDTRSIQVLSIFDNLDESLKIGMYATVQFYGEPGQYAVVEETAVLQAENDSYVLAQVSPQCLVRRPVKVDFTRDGLAYISQGLGGGDTVLREGGYLFQ